MRLWLLMGRTMCHYHGLELALRNIARDSLKPDDPRWVRISNMTFGQLIKHVATNHNFSGELITELSTINGYRNDFIHNFADRYALMMLSEDGEKMVYDCLLATCSYVGYVKTRIDRIQKRRSRRQGITDKKLMDQLVQMKKYVDHYFATNKVLSKPYELFQ